MPRSPHWRDRYALYEAAVQSVEADLDLFERVHRRVHGTTPQLFREDFCGTAAMACAWVQRGARRRAWGVDHDRRVLDWARRHHLNGLGPGAARVALRCGDVRAVRGPRADIVAAMNFSSWVFHERAALRGYFRSVRRSLRPGGIFFVHAFGGHDAMRVLEERTRVPASRGPDGGRIPAFTYVWEQARFDPVAHRLRCHIHFELQDGTRLRRAFTYDWRLWTLPEIREVLLEAGFERTEVHVQGPAARGPRDRYLLRRHFPNQRGWLALVAGIAGGGPRS